MYYYHTAIMADGPGLVLRLKSWTTDALALG